MRPAKESEYTKEIWSDYLKHDPYYSHTSPSYAKTSRSRSRYDAEEKKLTAKGVNSIDCLFVLGMHRSGVSVLAGCLDYAGIDLGGRFLSSAAGNGASSWQHQDIVVIHDMLLRDLGCEWDMVGNLPEGWQQSQAAGKARESIRVVLERDFRTSPLWAIADPRLCRLLPLWIPILAELSLNPGVVMTLRHPWEVASSLRDCNSFDLLQGHLLWLTSNREILATCQNLPHAIIVYDELLADPVLTLKALASHFGVVYPHALDQYNLDVLKFVRSDLKHYHAIDQVPGNPDRTAFVHFAELYEQLRLGRIVDAARELANAETRTQVSGHKTQRSPIAIATEGTRALQSTSLEEQIAVPEEILASAQNAIAVLNPSDSHAKGIFEDYLSLIGNYERAERDLERQKLRRLIRNKDQGAFSYAEILIPTRQTGENPTENVVKILLPQEEWQQAQIAIPDASALRAQRLRIKPLAAKGVVSISSIELVNVASGETCWKADKPKEFAKCDLHNALCMPNDDGLSLMLFSHDAEIALPELPDLPDCPLELCLWINVSTNQQPFAEFWRQLERREKKLEQALAEAHARQQASEGKLAEARDRQQAAEQEQRNRDQALAEAQARQQTSEQELAEAQHRQQAAEQEQRNNDQALAEAQARQETLKQKLTDAQARQQTSERELDEARDRQQAAEQEQQNREQALAEAQARRQTLEQELAEAQHRQQAAEQKQRNRDQALAKAQARQETSERELVEARDRQQAAEQEQRNRDQALIEAQARQEIYEDELQVKASALAEAFHRETQLSQSLESYQQKLRDEQQALAEVQACQQASERQLRLKELDALRRKYSIGWRSSMFLSGHDRRLQRHRQLILKSGYFDYGWYNASYPDVADAGADPLTHFIEYGASEGRCPGPAFDTKFYLERNPDVSKAGMNPLVHYLEYGKAEGRRPSAD